MGCDLVRVALAKLVTTYNANARNPDSYLFSHNMTSLMIYSKKVNIPFEDVNSE
jgi:hypothetical protein